jgi:hypothetical protein
MFLIYISFSLKKLKPYNMHYGIHNDLFRWGLFFEFTKYMSEKYKVPYIGCWVKIKI